MDNNQKLRLEVLMAVLASPRSFAFDDIVALVDHLVSYVQNGLEEDEGDE